MLEDYLFEKFPQDKEDIEEWLGEVTEELTEDLCNYVFKNYDLIDKEAKQPDNIMDIKAALKRIDPKMHEALNKKFDEIWKTTFDSKGEYYKKQTEQKVNWPSFDLMETMLK